MAGLYLVGSELYLHLLWAQSQEEFVALGPCMSCFRIHMESKVTVWLDGTWRCRHKPGASVREKEERELSFEYFQHKSSMSSDLD